MDKLSQANAKIQVANTAKLFNLIWNKSDAADMFRKSATYTTKEGKTGYRRNHIAPTHAYRTLSAAAGANLMNVVKEDMDILRTSMEDDAEFEKKGAPLLPTFSKGFVMLLNQILTAYAQQIVGRAEKVRKACIKSKSNAKISAKAMHIAALAVENNVFGETGHATHASYTPAMPIRKAKKATGDKKGAAATAA
jgi:hypothetical protein